MIASRLPIPEASEAPTKAGIPASKEGKFPAALPPPATVATGSSGWDPYEVWRTRVFSAKVSVRKD